MTIVSYHTGYYDSHITIVEGDDGSVTMKGLSIHTGMSFDYYSSSGGNFTNLWNPDWLSAWEYVRVPGSIIGFFFFAALRWHWGLDD